MPTKSPQNIGVGLRNIPGQMSQPSPNIKFPHVACPKWVEQNQYKICPRKVQLIANPDWFTFPVYDFEPHPNLQKCTQMLSMPLLENISDSFLNDQHLALSFRPQDVASCAARTALRATGGWSHAARRRTKRHSPSPSKSSWTSGQWRIGLASSKVYIYI